MAIPQSLAWPLTVIQCFLLQQSFLLTIFLAVHGHIERVVGNFENILFKLFPSYGTTLSFSFQVGLFENTVLCTAFLRPPRKVEDGSPPDPTPSARAKATGYFYRHAVRGGVVFSRAFVGRSGFESSPSSFWCLALLTFLFTRSSSTALLVASTHSGWSI